MTRIVTLALTLALTLAACSPVQVEDQTTVRTRTETLDDQGWVHGRAVHIVASVDSEARGMYSGVGVNVYADESEGDQARLDVYNPQTIEDAFAMMEGRGTPDARASEGEARLGLDPDFRICEGENYTVRADGGCDYETTLVVLTDRPRTLVIDGSVLVIPETYWEGDPDGLSIFIEINPE